MPRKKSKEFDNTYIQYDIFARLDFPDSSFDVVMAYQSLNHAKRPLILKAFSEVKRILKPKGIFAIRIANREAMNLENIKDQVYYDKDYDQKFEEIEKQTFVGIDGDEKGIIIYMFYEQELIKELENLGFTTINSRTDSHHIIANFRVS